MITKRDIGEREREMACEIYTQGNKRQQMVIPRETRQGFFKSPRGSEKSNIDFYQES
jgi:hypothetical protein